MVSEYKGTNKKTSQKLRSTMTNAEILLWSKLSRDQLGVRFYRQKPLGPFIVDFYCPHARLIVEVDGGQHYSGAVQTSDEQRDAYFTEQGYDVVRFSNLEVLHQLESVIMAIQEKVDVVAPVTEEKSPRPLSQRGTTIRTTAAEEMDAGESVVGEKSPCPLSQRGTTISSSRRNTICVPIVSTTIEGALLDIARAQELQADMVELRLDLLESVDADTLPQLLPACELPVIVTVRSASEGGKWQGTEYERFTLLEQALDNFVEYIDVELSADPALRKTLIERKDTTQVIVSHHDFEKTPDLESLWHLFQDEMATGADIGKIATMARTERDVQIIRDLLVRAEKARKACIALSMGELGTASRINAAAWGSLLTFASLDAGKGSAPGQFTINDMKLFEMKSRILNPLKV